MRKVSLILLICFSMLSCTHAADPNAKQQLLKKTVEELLKADPGLNSKGGYWISFGKQNFFDKEDMQRFLAKNRNFSRVNADSLYTNDSTYIKYGYLKQTLLVIGDVELKGDTLTVSCSKIFSSDGAFGMEVYFKKEKDGYVFLNAKMTWIS